MFCRQRPTTLHWLLAGLLLLLLLPALPAMPVRAATYTVTSTADDGSAGTLRYAINQVNAGLFDTIDFDSSVTGTILLTNGLPMLAKNVTINGPGADKLAVDGASLYRPLIVASTVTAATISGLTIQHGKADSGGAIFNDGKLTVTNSTLSDNTSTGTVFGYGGGAIMNRPGRTLIVTNSTFSGNSAAYGGGAIEVYQSSTYSVTVTNSTFSQNSAPSGGAIEAWNGGTLTVANSTFSGNSASGQGGAIYKTFQGQMTLTNDTFAGNSAFSAGGGIRNSGPATLTNMIVATNTAPTGPDIYGGSGSAGHNLIGNGSGTNDTNGVNGDLVGTSASPINPLLGTLGNNGGPTQTMALLPGSPAINAGDDAVCAAAPVSGVDQRGTTRPQGAHCDIGAFELVITDTTAPTTTASPDRQPNANGWYKASVTVTLTATDNAGGTGVAKIEYDLDSAGWTTYTTPVAIATEGKHTLQYRSTDSAGNVETPGSLAAWIDTTAPTVTYTGNAESYTVDQTVSITCTATDSLSGVATKTCDNITGPAYTFKVGTNTYNATATDNAGNTGTGTTSFTVTVTATSFDAVIAKLVSDPSVVAPLQKQVDQIVSAPNAKAKTAQVNAFTKLVKAQTGKSITTENAAILIKLVNAL